MSSKPRKTAAAKPKAAAKTAAKTAAPEPMDASMPEVQTPEVRTNTQRNSYALDALIEEVRNLFPETAFEVSNYDWRNAALDVQFTTDEEDLPRLLSLVDTDERVAEVLDDGAGTLLVSLHPNPRVQDSRETFGLAEAYKALSGTEDAL